LKDIITNQEERQLEPFTSVMEAAENYGRLAMLEAIHLLLGFDVAQNSCCPKCQRKAQFLHGGLSELLAMYMREFPSNVDHVGAGLVQ
jgi:hypothetical protein